MRFRLRARGGRGVALAARYAALAGMLGLATGSPDELAGQASTPQPERPNIIYILLDDVGFSDVGAYGSEISTPNIDALAAAGLRYNRFDTRAICSPTRAALLTGRNNQAVGMMDLTTNPSPTAPAHSQGFITPAAATIAQMLQAHGYGTSALGKWHLAPPAQYADGSTDRSNWPSGKGFQNYYGFLTGWTDQYEPLERGVGGRMNEGDRPILTPAPPGYHVSEALVARAIDYLKADAAAGRPSFVYLAFGAGHSPIQAPREFIDRYRGVYDKGWDRIREERFARQKRLGIIPASAVLTPRAPEDPAWESLSADQKRVYARFMEVYAGFIDHTDAQIGKLITYLKETGEFDNTLIFFMSDNGGASENLNGGFDNPYEQRSLAEMLARLDEFGGPNSAGQYQRPWGWVASTPFQRYKLWPHAGGVRDPLIVTWPRVIREAGAIRSQYVEAIDITPTVLDVLGLEAPSVVNGVAQMPMHGASIRQTFTDATTPTRTTQFYLMRGNRAITHGDWKAVAIHRNGTPFEQDQWELYNVAQDYSESRNVAAQHPEKLRELVGLWWSEATKYGGLPLIERGAGGGGGARPPGGAASQ